MSSAEKIRHWAQEKPWEIDGKRLRLPPTRPFSPGQVEVVGGFITRGPIPIGRPCFGQPTAFLRHGGARYIYAGPGRGNQPTRCARCPIREACEFVAVERLQCTPKLAELY